MGAAFVEQGGVDFGGGLVGEAWFVQQVEHLLLLLLAQRPIRFWAQARSLDRHGQGCTSAYHAGA